MASKNFVHFVFIAPTHALAVIEISYDLFAKFSFTFEIIHSAFHIMIEANSTLNFETTRCELNNNFKLWKSSRYI